MDYVTYSLVLDKEKSNDYYIIVSEFSNQVINKILLNGKEYINDVMKFIENKNIEKLRDEKEYGIEILLIGIVLNEYRDYARAFKRAPKTIFTILNNLREYNEKYKTKVDDIRGKLITKILMREKKSYKAFSLEDFKLIIKWMDASGDFKEEILRLNNWKFFMKNKHENYVDKFLDFCDNLSNDFYIESREILGLYTNNVMSYLETYKVKHNNKEDIIYCGKGEIQYFFNMVSAEIMNSVYRNEFLNCDRVIVFLPSCMTQTNSECLSIKTPNGYKCKSCSKYCNVNKLTKIGVEKGFNVFIIPHETLLLKLGDECSDNIGIIGIACTLNLFSGGLKAIRLGFKPQCVVLEFCGCSNHWLDRSIMTNINIDRLKFIISK